MAQLQCMDARLDTLSTELYQVNIRVGRIAKRQVTMGKSGDLKITWWGFWRQVFPIRKQIIVSFIFCCILQLFGDLFVLPRILHVNLIN